MLRQNLFKCPYHAAVPTNSFEHTFRRIIIIITRDQISVPENYREYLHLHIICMSPFFSRSSCARMYNVFFPEKLHSVRSESQARPSVYTQTSMPVQSVVVRDLSAI